MYKILVDIELLPLSAGFIQIISLATVIAAAIMLIKNRENSVCLMIMSLLAYFCMSVHGIDLKLLFLGPILLLFAVSFIKKFKISSLCGIIVGMLLLFLIVLCNFINISIPAVVSNGLFLILSVLFTVFSVKMFAPNQDIRMYSRCLIFGLITLETIVFLYGSIKGYSELKTYITSALFFHYISGIIFELIYLINGENEVDKNEKVICGAIQIFPAGGLFVGGIYNILGCLSVPDGLYLMGVVLFSVLMLAVYVYQLFVYFNREVKDITLGTILSQWKNTDFYIKAGLLIAYVSMGIIPSTFLKGSGQVISTYWKHTKWALPKEILLKMLLVNDVIIVFAVLTAAYVTAKLLYLRFRKV